MTTQEFKKLPRKERVAINREHHEALLQVIGENLLFACKSPAPGQCKFGPLPKGKYGFFESEIKQDCYFEYTDFDTVSTDATRQLYVLKYDPNYETNKTKFERVELSPTGKEQYYVDQKYFEKVTYPTTVAEDFEMEFEEIRREDMGVEKLTARDQVCIMLKIPESNHKWINDLIAKAL